MDSVSESQALPEMAERPARLAVAVIGAGRVGSVLGAALRRAGHHVVAVTAISQRSQDRAELMLPGVPITTPEAAAAAGDLLILAVPDDQLSGLVGGLAANGALRPGQLVAHTSGRHGLAILDPASSCSILPLALHPAMTFTGTPVDLERLDGACFGITAMPELVAVAQALVVEMGGEPVVIAERDRGLYHAALAHGANHLVTLVSQAVDLLRAAGAETPERLIAPLLSAALDNALRSGDRALTGPVARGDAETVAKHLAEISQAMPTATASYLALARASADRAMANGMLDATKAAKLLEVLATRPTGAAR